MKKYEYITAAILAGGKSRRFGAQKMTACFGKQTLLEIAVQLARQLSDHVAIIGDAVSKSLLKDIHRHSDVFPDNGPLGGIHAAMKYASTPFVALIPCDMPLLIADVYHVLVSYNHENRPVVGVSHSGLEPLISIWPRITVSLIEKRLSKGQTSHIEALDELKAIRIPLTEKMTNYSRKFFININTREDLKLHVTSNITDANRSS